MSDFLENMQDRFLTQSFRTALAHNFGKTEQKELLKETIRSQGPQEVAVWLSNDLGQTYTPERPVSTDDILTNAGFLDLSEQLVADGFAMPVVKENHLNRYQILLSVSL